MDSNAVTGTAHFDLSTFRAWEIRKFPKTNETYRIRYPERLAKTPPLRGVMQPEPENITEADFDRLADWGVTLVRFQMTGGAKGWDSTVPLRSIFGGKGVPSEDNPRKRALVDAIRERR